MKVFVSKETMIFRTSLTILVSILLANFANLGESAFALRTVEERKLLSCLWRSLNSEQHCFGKSIFKRSLSETEYSLDLAPANEYLCALNDYQNSKRTANDAVRAVLDSGSCSRTFPSVATTWKEFLRKRGKEIRMKTPFWQHANGSRIIARFTQGNHTISYVTESLKAVDIIISRSLDDEIYGKYFIRASMRKGDDESVVTHESVQATCPTDGKRFFVAGLSEKGRKEVQNWLETAGRTMELTVDVFAQRRITQGHPPRQHHRVRRPDLGLKISAILLHFAESSFSGVPVSDRILFPMQARRRRRSATDCHRETYIANYRHNTRVIRPVEFDIGECVGNCDRAPTLSFSSHLNATDHALIMIWEQMNTPTPGNARPTVCCVPIFYGHFHFIKRDDYGLPMSTFSKGMVAKYCGCR